MQPSASTLKQMFDDDTPIGEYSKQRFEEMYNPADPIAKKVQHIISYAVNVHSEEKDYWMVSPHGGEDITIHTIAELAMGMATQKGFTEEEICVLRKALLDGGYLEEEIKAYTNRYSSAYIQLQTLRHDFLKYEARMRQIENRLAEMYALKQEIFAEIQNQQDRYLKTQKNLKELTTLMWVFHPFRSANHKNIIMSEVRDCANKLQNAYIKRADCERTIDELESVRDDPCVTPSAPLMYIYDSIYPRSAKTLHDVEIGEESARRQIKECEEFFALYGMEKPRIE